MENILIPGLILADAAEKALTGLLYIIAAIVAFIAIIRFFQLCSNVKKIRELLEKSKENQKQ